YADLAYSCQRGGRLDEARKWVEQSLLLKPTRAARLIRARLELNHALADQAYIPHTGIQDIEAVLAADGPLPARVYHEAARLRGGAAESVGRPRVLRTGGLGGAAAAAVADGPDTSGMEEASLGQALANARRAREAGLPAEALREDACLLV